MTFPVSNYDKFLTSDQQTRKYNVEMHSRDQVKTLDSSIHKKTRLLVKGFFCVCITIQYIGVSHFFHTNCHIYEGVQKVIEVPYDSLQFNSIMFPNTFPSTKLFPISRKHLQLWQHNRFPPRFPAACAHQACFVLQIANGGLGPIHAR